MPPERELNTLRERIAESDTIHPEDGAVIEAFDDRLSLLAQEYSTHRHLKLLRHVTIIAESNAIDGGTLAASLDNRDAAEDIVAWINREYDNEETNRDYRSALRVFGKRVTDGDDQPDSLGWVPTSTSSTYDPTPDPSQMLRWDTDIKPMLGVATYSRDAAMVALQFDAGLRGGEFKDLQRGDVTNHKHGLQVTVTGKQGRRTVLLIPSVPYVSRWLEDHPGDADDPLWTHLNRPESVSDRLIYDRFETLADEVGVNRPVTLTNFRKSSAAFLASRNLNQAHIEDHHGWVRGSDAAARYIAVFAESSDRELARLHGLDVSDEEPEDIGPVDCPTCGRQNAHDAALCDQCGQALRPDVAAEIETEEESRQETLANLSPDQAVAFLDLINDVDVDQLRDDLHDLEH